MSLPVELRDDARQEYDEAVDWYEAQRPGRGVAFISAVRRVFRRISSTPNFYGVVVLDIRKAVVPGFPYCVYYYEEPHRVVVISVFHTSRDQAIWQGRR
jgi:plasmid stabilization system protein ParE